MKHQITLVGGQSLPVLLGIKEFEPEKVHFIYSKESKRKIASIKKMVPQLKTSELLVDPFDFDNIKSVCSKIIDKFDTIDEVTFNLTGGTKIMVLAVQALILERDLQGFYINQNNTVLNIPGYSRTAIKTRLSAADFFKLSGHSHFKATTFNNINKDDMKAAKAIDAFSHDKKYKKVISYIRSIFSADNLPINGNITVGKDKQLKCVWSERNIEITFINKSVFKCSSSHLRHVFFNGGWWELLVASELNNRIKPFELLTNVELPFISDQSQSKSEIDILINDNNKLILIECKSGKVKLEDINKMRTIKETYGGLVSKSILVAQFPLNDSIKERCNELEIEVFIGMTRQFNGLITTINKLAKNTSL